MDIIFKFGEHYYQAEESSWLISLLVTLIGTFIGFFLALFLDKKVDKRNLKRKELEELNNKLDALKYLKTILDSLISYIPKQTEKIKEFSELLKKSPLEIVHPEILATYDLIRLRNADNVNTQDAYINFNKVSENPYKDYKNLFAHGDYLLREMESIETQTERAIGFKHKDQLTVRDVLEEISFMLMNRMQFLLGQSGYDESLALKDDEYNFLATIADSYASIIQKMMLFARVRDEIIEPLMGQSLTIIKDDTLKIKILELARKAHSRLTNIEGNSNYFADDIGGLENRLEKALEYLKKESKKIEMKITSHNKTYKQ